MADSGEDDTICPICSKGYKATGEHVPKFLPCSHTVCEKCITRKLLKRDHLDCPQCNGLHFAHDGVGTFPTNKYVLISTLKPNQRRVKLEISVRHTARRRMYSVMFVRFPFVFCA